MKKTDRPSSAQDFCDQRSEFPFFENHPNLVYLDSAATTQKPRKVLDALYDFYENCNANPDRGLYDLGYEATELHQNCRQVVADFLNCSPDEIIFTSGATESLNLAAELVSANFSAISPKSTQPNFVTTSILEHHSSFLPWQQRAKHLNFLECDKFGRISDAEITRKITPETEVVAVTLASNILGIKTPIEKIVKRAREVGSLIIADAAQLIPYEKIDLQKLDVDFLAFSGHKMYAPMGIGVLYGKRELLEKCRPVRFGGQMIEHVSRSDATWAEIPRRFEPGTRNLAGELGLKTAIDFLEPHLTTTATRHLVELCYDSLSELPFVELISPRDALSIVSFNLKNIHPHDVATVLNDEKICIRAGNHCAEPLMDSLGLENGCCRASFGVYNDEKDVEKFVSAVKKAWEILK